MSRGVLPGHSGTRKKHMMNTRMIASFVVIVAVVCTGVTSAWAKPKKEAPSPLTAAGEQLKQQYAKELEKLEAKIVAAVPNVSQARKDAYAKAVAVEDKAIAELGAAQKNLGQIKKAQGLVGHAKGKWIGGAKAGIKKSKAALAKAKTDAEREKAQAELAKWEKNLADGQAALKERQAKLDAALAMKDTWEKQLQEAQQAVKQAKANTLEAVENLKLRSFLTSDKLDGDLAKYMVISEATPHGLAAYAQQGSKHKKLIDKLLADEQLMVRMLIADGASDGNYGRAMEIYTTIQQTSPKASEGVLERLALAVALEHATPISQRNAKTESDAPSHVDPIARYKHYEQAYLGDELDPYFKDQPVWNLRFVVNGHEPNETLVWGREMMRNYRPDHITTKDNRWRYVAAVRTEIRYGSQENKFDQDNLQFFQNILKNGGVCGRRAFFGRFVLRAFGNPTIARPSPGHAALARWTPDGWVVVLGGGWGAGTTKTRYRDDLDFLATTQARATGEPFMIVKRAQWIGNAMGEKPVYGLNDRNDPEFWYGVSLYMQRQIIENAKLKTLAAVGEELGEANESDIEYAFHAAKITDADRKISVSDEGVITIPAAATSKPTKSTGKIIFTPSILGGLQLHYSRTGGNQDFQYTFDAPAAGTYAMTMKVVTPSWKQYVKVSANDGKATEFELPFTVGMWQTSKPIEIELKQGKNVLTFSRQGVSQPVRPKGFTVKEIVLTPAGKQLSQAATTN